MRRMLLRMIATGSLSAFSSAALQGLPSQAAHPAGGTVQRARATEVQPQQQPQAQVPVQSEQVKPGSQSGGKIVPRGSLIDLSV